MRIVNIGLILLCFISLQSCVPEPTVDTLEGTWSCKETSEIYLPGMKGTSIYPVYFAQDAEDDHTYFIDNFYQLGEGVSVKIKISGYNIMIGKQTVEGIVIEGIGTVNSTYSKVILTYTANDGGGDVDHVSAEYTRSF